MPNASDSAIARKIKNGSKLADGIWAPGGSGQITRESKKDKTAKITVRMINLFEIFIQKNFIFEFDFVGAAGLEPATFGPPAQRSSHLNYAPFCFLLYQISTPYSVIITLMKKG